MFLPGLRIPLIQAPVGSAAGPALCIAVCEGGALGSLALTWKTPEIAAAQVRSVAAATAAPFAVNFALAFPPRSLAAALEAGARCVTFSWGDPSPYLPLPVPFGMQCTDEPTARQAVECGASFVIAQGLEAGGHVEGRTSWSETLAAVRRGASRRPVLSAGGVGTPADVRRRIEAGADGVVVGTRFVAAAESEAHPDYRQALVAASAEDTVLTECFSDGWPNAPHRVLRNPTWRRWSEAGSPSQDRPGDGDVVALSASGEPIYRYEDALPRHDYTGALEEMALYAGTSVSAVERVITAREILNELWPGS